MRNKAIITMWLAAAFALTPPAFAQLDTDLVIINPEGDLDEEPRLVFQAVEWAWRRGDAQKLAALASGSRVFMQMRGVEQKRGAYFSKSQVYYLFKRIFATTNQVHFHFIKYRSLDNQERRVYGIAERSYKILRTGTLYNDKVYVTLVREGPRWAVAEIKSTR